MPTEDANGRPPDASHRHRGEQYRGRGRVRLEVLLDHQAPHRMPDDNRRLWHTRRGGGQVLHVFGDPRPAQSLAAGRGAVPPEVDRMDVPAPVGEVPEEVLLPAPRPVPGTVNEQDRRHSVSRY